MVCYGSSCSKCTLEVVGSHLGTDAVLPEVWQKSSLYIGDAWILLRKTSTSGNQKKKRDIPGAIPFHDATPGETVIKEETSMAQKTHECCT